MDAADCSPTGPAWSWQAIRHRRTSLMSGGLCRQSPRDLWVNPCKHGSSDALFAFAELRTYPTPSSLHHGRVGLVPLLLRAAWPNLESQDFSCLLRDHWTRGESIDPYAPKGQKEIAQGRAKRRPGYACATGALDRPT